MGTRGGQLVKFKIETVGEERFIKGFSRITQDMGNFEEPFRVILGDFRATESALFATEGTSEGESRWSPLTKKYSEWKERNFPGQAIMSLRGALRASLTGKSSWTVEDISSTSALFGTAVPYAHRHQVGYKMPQRRIVQATNAVKLRWTRIISRWSMGLFEKHGIVDYGTYKGAGF